MPRASLAASRASLSRRPKQRIRVMLQRQPLLLWAFVVLTGVLAFWSINAAIRSTTEAKAVYGSLVEVVVATRTIEAGELVGPTSVELTALPNALVPPEALREIPVGQSARNFISAGEAVISSRLAPLGTHGLAASLSPAERAIAVPTNRDQLSYEVGMRVDVLQTVNPFSVGAQDATRSVVHEARVVAVEEMAVIIAVPVERVERVATALASSVVTLVVTPN